jgi:sulfate adenylyltransferase subunit 1
MDLLRLITAGSVDDGKSTLIGRLLYDSKNIWIDQIEQLEQISKNKKATQIDLALLTDGLRAEREQGITDVAYRYFSSPHRKFIIADAPGHIQYTRNMVTGASNSDLMILLIDARQGVIEQTRRHSIIASLLQIPYIIVTINKMDLVGFDQKVYNQITTDYKQIAGKLNLKNVHFIPISALDGDNVVNSSEKMPWYTGSALLPLLESIDIHATEKDQKARFQVQYVIRPQTEDLHDYRGYAGQIAGNIFSKGDKIKILPQNRDSEIASLEHHGLEVNSLGAGNPAVIHIADDIDISRGDYIVKSDEIPYLSKQHEVILCWFDEKPLHVTNKYLLQHRSKLVKAIIKGINYRLDVNTLEKETDINKLELNQVASVNINTASALAYDKYENSKFLGPAILIDETSHKTVAALLFKEPISIETI